MTASSALMVIGHILLCYTLFFSFNKPFGYGTTVVEKNKSHVRTGTENKSHAPPPPCSVPEKSLRGPCSPFGQKKPAATSSQTLLNDERRVQVMNSRSYNMPKTIGEDSNQFLVSVGFGTPVQYFKLILDTGSYVTWVRCRRCTRSPCQLQQYDPSSSLTSSDSSCWPLPCTASSTLRYLDGSFSKGYFMNDTFSIEGEKGTPDFGFLCATDDRGDFGNADGVLGLGMAGDEHGSYSLISQTSTNVFCHCLSSSGIKKEYVYFGEKAHQNCPFSGYYTPLISDPSDASKYVVKLTAITIGRRRVEIYSDGGAIMDTGTVITRLPSSVYSELRSEFEELMSGFNPVPASDDTDNVLHTCYNLQGYDDSAIPNTVLHFDNLDVNLEPAAVISEMNGMSQVCLAFAEKEDEGMATIIGSHQMQKLNILYNILEKRVEFGPGNC